MAGLRRLAAVITSRFTDRIKPQAILSCNYSKDIEKRIEERSSWVTLNDNGSVVVCWHPEQKFPYEDSKPLPLFSPDLNETDSVLNVQHRLLHKYRHSPDGPSRDELQKLTFTTKHRWYPNNRRAKKRITPRQDRDFL